MTKLFGVDIAAELNNAMGPGLLSVTLRKSTPGVRTPGSLSAGTNPTTAEYIGRGFKDPSMSSLRPDTRVENAKGIFFLLGASLPTGIKPEAGDFIRLTAETEFNAILEVSSDPAEAGYTCQYE